MAKNGAVLWLITVIAITSLMGGISWISLNGLIANNARVEKSHYTLESLQATLLVITDIEDGARGYILSGEERYLTAYSTGTRNWRKNFRKSSDLIGDDREQTPKLEVLEQAITERLRIADGLITTRKTKGLNAAVKELKSGRGIAVMDKIRSMINQMVIDETNMMHKDSDNSVTQSRQLILITALILIGYGSVSTLLPVLKKKS